MLNPTGLQTSIFTIITIVNARISSGRHTIGLECPVSICAEQLPNISNPLAAGAHRQAAQAAKDKTRVNDVRERTLL
jgi:hypothetical protein